MTRPSRLPGLVLWMAAAALAVAALWLLWPSPPTQPTPRPAAPALTQAPPRPRAIPQPTAPPVTTHSTSSTAPPVSDGELTNAAALTQLQNAYPDHLAPPAARALIGRSWTALSQDMTRGGWSHLTAQSSVVTPAQPTPGADQWVVVMWRGRTPDGLDLDRQIASVRVAAGSGALSVRLGAPEGLTRLH